MSLEKEKNVRGGRCVEDHRDANRKNRAGRHVVEGHLGPRACDDNDVPRAADIKTPRERLEQIEADMIETAGWV